MWLGTQGIPIFRGESGEKVVGKSTHVCLVSSLSNCYLPIIIQLHSLSFLLESLPSPFGFRLLTNKEVADALSRLSLLDDFCFRHEREIFFFCPCVNCVTVPYCVVLCVVGFAWTG